MALKLNISGFNIPNMLNLKLNLENVSEIYIKIDAYTVNENNCEFRVNYFNRTVEEESINLIPLSIPTQYFKFSVIEDGSENDVNTRQQGYEFLKTLPEFLDCEDC